MLKINTEKLADGVKLPLNMLEREIAPSLIVLTFLISVGAFQFFQLFLTLVLIGGSVFLFMAYRQVNQHKIAIGRIIIVVITSFLFLTLLSDDHIFEDSSLLQIIEEHMTESAKLRHGIHAKSLDELKSQNTANSTIIANSTNGN